MVRVKVKISQVIVMETRKVYKTGEEFECSEETASNLRNAVTVLGDSEPLEPLEPDQPSVRKRK